MRCYWCSVSTSEALIARLMREEHMTREQATAASAFPMCEFSLEYDEVAADGGVVGSWHFKRTCLHCGETWAALHCPCDGHQNPCPACDIRPTPIDCPQNTSIAVQSRPRSD